MINNKFEQGMPSSKTSASDDNTQLGLPEKGHAIKGLVFVRGIKLLAYISIRKIWFN